MVPVHVLQAAADRLARPASFVVLDTRYPGHIGDSEIALKPVDENVNYPHTRGFSAVDGKQSTAKEAIQLLYHMKVYCVVMLPRFPCMPCLARGDLDIVHLLVYEV